VVLDGALKRYGRQLYELGDDVEHSGKQQRAKPADIADAAGRAGQQYRFELDVVDQRHDAAIEVYLERPERGRPGQIQHPDNDGQREL
jgi:hypothetical protein